MRADLHEACPVLVVKLHGAAQMPVAHREPGIVEAHERSNRYLRIRRYPSARGTARRRLNSCGQRRADSRPAIRIAEAANLEVRERDKFRQVIATVVESFRLDSQTERSEGQTQLTLTQINLLSVFGRKPQSDASIVKVNCEGQARIVRPGRVGGICREQESVRVSGGRKIVGLIP